MRLSTDLNPRARVATRLGDLSLLGNLAASALTFTARFTTAPRCRCNAFTSANSSWGCVEANRVLPLGCLETQGTRGDLKKWRATHIRLNLRVSPDEKKRKTSAQKRSNFQGVNFVDTCPATRTGGASWEAKTKNELHFAEKGNSTLTHNGHRTPAQKLQTSLLKFT